jgi:hypothetical protein
MKNLKRLVASVVLTFVLGLSAFAGEVLTPPCAAPESGEVLTPPCAAAPRSMSTPNVTPTVSGDMGTPTNNEASFINLAADVLLSFLPLF